MAVDINWGMAKGVPNLLGIGVEAYDEGRKRARDQGVQNALSRSQQDPAGAQADLMRYGAVDEANALAKQQAEARRRQMAGQYGSDPAAARKAALENGDLDLVATFNGLDADQRKAAEERMELFGAVGNRIRSVPYEQRRAALAQLAPMLLERGISAEQLEAFDPTDEGIDAIIGSVVSLKDQLKAADAPAGMIRNPDGSLTWAPGYVESQRELAGATSGARREAVVSRPMPSRAKGGGRSSGSSSPARSYGSGAEPEW